MDIFTLKSQIEEIKLILENRDLTNGERNMFEDLLQELEYELEEYKDYAIEFSEN